MTHYSVLWMFGYYYNSHKPDTMHLALLIIVALFLLVGLAYVVMVVTTSPTRNI